MVGFSCEVTVAPLPPESPPVGPDDPGLADTFGPPDGLVDLPGAGLTPFCPGSDLGTTVPGLGKAAPPAAEYLVVEQGACPVVLPFAPMVVDLEGSSEVGFVFSAAGTEAIEFEATGFEAAGTETVGTVVARFEVVEGAEVVMTGLYEGKPVLLMLAYPSHGRMVYTCNRPWFVFSAFIQSVLENFDFCSQKVSPRCRFNRFCCEFLKSFFVHAVYLRWSEDVRYAAD
jgi:hypothetical protein